jgi:hypothetical protein
MAGPKTMIRLTLDTLALWLGDFPLICFADMSMMSMYLDIMNTYTDMEVMTKYIETYDISNPSNSCLGLSPVAFHSMKPPDQGRDVPRRSGEAERHRCGMLCGGCLRTA